MTEIQSLGSKNKFSLGVIFIDGFPRPSWKNGSHLDLYSFKGVSRKQKITDLLYLV